MHTVGERKGVGNVGRCGDGADGREAAVTDGHQSSWVRAPQQGRSQETLDRLLDALEALLDERPFDEISVADIAGEAGRTVGSFYGRFDDKDAALYALHLRYIDADRRAVNELFRPERFASGSLQDAVHSMVAILVGHYRHPRSSFRTVILRSASKADFLAQCKDAARSVGDAWTAALLSRRDEIDDPDPERCVALAFRNMLAVLNQDLLFGAMVPPRREADHELTDDLTALTMRMLGASAELGAHR
jgi:AcrR family transcriptional regulator